MRDISDKDLIKEFLDRRGCTHFKTSQRQPEKGFKQGQVKVKPGKVELWTGAPPTYR